MSQGQAQLPDMSMNPAELYREEVFTDRQVGTLRRMTPVDGQGNVDSSRPVLYSGQTQLMTPAGALPLMFDIEASSLEEAARKFGEEAEKTLKQTMEELQEMRRQAASSIVIPGQEPSGGFGGMGGGLGGGGGRIKL
ncbi:hypothetical protein [Permianibacter aggregans]|uniref:Cytoplasmic protein n=1 Tax=Permianibacter aggregans TaxID=1510150 RepID=A0A4R6UF96_9GAMM|nr:hypothetical protein [Permianibacter aggregans]TDQ45431.1 hypothetical protein EV696_1208 [Permianibacter aggregans]